MKRGNTAPAQRAQPLQLRLPSGKSRPRRKRPVDPDALRGIALAESSSNIRIRSYGTLAGAANIAKSVRPPPFLRNRHILGPETLGGQARQRQRRVG